ncbi:MAG: SH3 domain-containing protein [Nitrospira sp.]|nr:SH3 domain-containing protein [Nitrospira sp.]
MVSSTGIPAIRSEWTNWPLLFASQPEPDLEFTEEDLDESVPPPAPPMNSPKRSGKKPLLWILLLLLVGGVGYVAMDPDGAMQLIEPYLDRGAEPVQPVIQKPPVKDQASKQAPTVAPPAPPVVADNSTPAPADVPAPSSAMPAPAIPAPATPALQPAAPTPKSATPASKPATSAILVAGPLYAEGQRVTVIADPTRPKSPIPLFVDAVGTKTSTTVLAGATLTILDGDYQKRGWVYSVRAQDGRKGWIPERSLRLKR